MLEYKCSICQAPSVEDLEFEGGNNAELSTTLSLCEVHFQEYEKEEGAFQDKYAELIDRNCYEDLISNAEGA